MSVLESLNSYIQGELGLNELFERIQIGTWPGSPETSDLWALEARAILSEATSAGWPEDQIRLELAQMLMRWSFALPSYPASLRDGDTYDAGRGVLALATNMHRDPVDLEEITAAAL